MPPLPGAASAGVSWATGREDKMVTKGVVVGYDGSQCSRAALAWGMREAGNRGLPLLIAHAGYTPTAPIAGFVTMVETDTEALGVAAEEMLALAMGQVRRDAPALEVLTAVVPGPVVPVLLKLMDGAELGVVGTRGLSTFHELLVGSTSLQLAAHAPCPLVVVRSSGSEEPGPEAGRVVVGVDGSTGAAAAIAFAFEEASMRGCGLTAMSVWQVPSFDSYGWGSVADDRGDRALFQRAMGRRLSEGMAGWAEKYADVDVRESLVHGEVAAALVKASNGAEMVVVGSRGRGGFKSLVLGSVSHAVLHHAHSTVAVVRQPVN
jgi:nucleotide-binding universal stress UspA family protein